MKGDLSIFYFFLSIFSYFSTVDIHSFGYTHTHTFFKGPPKLHFPYQQPFNTSGSAAKIPCSSFIKSSELGFPDFTPDTGFMRIHLPGNGLEGGKKQILSCQIGYKARTLGFLGECQGLHLLAYTQQESWPASQPECRRNNTYRPSWQVCIAFILSGAKRPGQGGFVP